MSLDVYLYLFKGKVAPLPDDAHSGIFIREDGQTKEISRAEWDARWPGREPVVALNLPDEETEEEQVYSANITHNLVRMADEAGLYDCLWRPDEHGLTHAQHLIEPLQRGLAFLLESPEGFLPLNPANGWGTYEGLMQFVRDYLEACTRYPQARVSVSR